MVQCKPLYHALKINKSMITVAGFAVSSGTPHSETLAVCPTHSEQEKEPQSNKTDPHNDNQTKI